MNTHFEPLFSKITLNNGIELDSRFVMAPMVVEGSSYEGYVESDDIEYFKRRSKTASLLITGATAVAEHGNAFGNGLACLDDSYLPGLTKLATTMKTDGAKAVLQIFHPGREAKYSYQKNNIVYGPSDSQFSFLDYPTTGFNEEQVDDMIQAFSDATLRAIRAGFDGVEIHGANHYLIQQFFSPFSNKREDKWGGSLENRSRFALSIVKAVKKVIKENATKPFILGYRISPEEINEGDIGYTLDDSLYLIDKIAEIGVDYIHISLKGPSSYALTASSGKHKGQSINQVIQKLLKDRTLHVVVGDITDPDKALDALNYGDLVALASVAIVDPDFTEKIEQNREKDISLVVSNRLDDLKLPKNFGTLAGVLANNQSVPEETIRQLRLL